MEFKEPPRNIDRPDTRHSVQNQRPEAVEKVTERKHPPKDKDKFKKVLGEKEGDQDNKTKKQSGMFGLVDDGVATGPVAGEEKGLIDLSGQVKSVLDPSKESIEVAPLSAAMTGAVAGVASGDGKANLGLTSGDMSGADMKTIAKNLADQIVIQVKGDISETSVQIKNIPLLDGATLTLKEFGSAKGEFNIDFHGLSNEAKALLDLGANQNALRSALDGRGIPIHIITTNTDQSTRNIATEAGKERGDSEGGHGFDDQGKQQKGKQR